MRTLPFGPTGVAVPVLGQGTWNMERDGEREVLAALAAGIDAGMTHIDTAELYGSGRVERLVGRAIAGRRREELFIVSKVLPSNASYRDTLAACERSLRRLGTDYLDVYLLHWRGGVPLAETLRAFEELEAAGKIRAYGVSNFDVDDLEEAVSIAGEGRIACNQVLYHLNERSIEFAVLPWCRQHNVALVAYSPLGSGDFPSPRTAGGKVLAEIGERRGLTPHQVALAFLLQRSGGFAIPKAADTTHVLQNAAVGDVELEPEELERIDAAFPAKRRRGLAMI
ncbi:MAG TPA: aldo/keto reductase [Gammaproteobacteria bacterium]